MSKTATTAVLQAHLATLSHATTRRIRLRDLYTHYAVPLGAAVAIAAAGARLSDVGQVIAGAAILAGFAFALAIFVFQLRIEAARDPRIDKGALVLELLDELFDNVNYLMVVGLLLVLVAIASVSFRGADSGELGFWWTSSLLAIGIHYVLTILMCMKRLRRAYAQFII